jgi:hypothetical protein
VARPMRGGGEGKSGRGDGDGREALAAATSAWARLTMDDTAGRYPRDGQHCNVDGLSRGVILGMQRWVGVRLWWR